VESTGENMTKKDVITFWEKTGQTWKIYLICLLGVLWGLLFVSGIFGFNIVGDPVIEKFLLFIAFTMGLVLFFFLRCPECGTNLGYKIVRKEPVNKFLQEIVNISKCPNCEEIRNRGKVIESRQNDGGSQLFLYTLHPTLHTKKGHRQAVPFFPLRQPGAK
jgi:hypothetical protein